MKKSSSELLMGLFFILMFFSYLNDTNSSWNAVFILFYAGAFGFITFLTGIFDWREYYNRNNCLMFVNMALLGVLILVILRVGGNSYFYIFIIGMFLLISVAVAYDFNHRMKKYQRVNAYNETLKIDPGNINALNSKGVVFEELKEYKKAVKIYDNALRIDSEYATPWYNRGNTLSKMRKYKDAVKSYDKALEIDPEHAKTWINKGNSLTKLGKYPEAIDCYDKALEINPKNVRALYNKGAVFGDTGKYLEALDCYDKLIELNPENVKVWYFRGTVLKKLGKLQEAIESYETALGLDPDFKPAKKAKKKLIKIIG
jgi:tetratricopeptide (TPR) repeat protein